MSQLIDHVDRLLLLGHVCGRGGRYQDVCAGSEMYLSTLSRQMHPETTKKGTCAIALHEGLKLCHS
eukprot:12899841-Prorocentrum_lima.AAC.1